jgi:hypothetical protein
MQTKFRIVETEDYILAVSDEEKATIGYNYNSALSKIDKLQINCSKHSSEWNFCNKIIAYQPKGNTPELDLPLLPEMVFEPKGFDEFEYTEEDLINLVAYIANFEDETDCNIASSGRMPSEIVNSFIRSLKQPTPTWFVSETCCDYIGCPKLILNGTNSTCCGDKTKLKTTTTDGKEYLVGEYTND